MFSVTQTVIALSCAVGCALAVPAPFTNTSRSGAHSGDLTYYEPGLGACGETNSASDHVVALSQSDYPGGCGKTITIYKGGKTATATVVDKCMGCAAGDIDVSPTVFEEIADLAVGRLQVTWDYN
ncbi:RlpA-like double-psi beta-barrel-protein domain-containing protein-containing protein [Xylariaceae sp. FL0804]|nr:RlpA-like double-psi beta-barrel-protein domain-containing protein-containing protein [Xylariaceae sp. FL0804]